MRLTFCLDWDYQDYWDYQDFVDFTRNLSPNMLPILAIVISL
jgi:hypothetical protein